VLHRIHETTPAAFVLRPRRHRRFEEERGLDADVTFTRDFLSEGRVAEFLAAGMSGVAAAAFASPVLTGELFCALDHPEAAVRARALRAMENLRPPAHPLPYGAITAILRRLDDDDVATVRAAGLLARHLVAHAEHRARIVEAAKRLLPRWAHDIATTGVLERIVGDARPASPPVPPSDDCRRPRSIAEMRFLASLGPCPGCRHRDDPGGNYYTFDNLGTHWRLTWPCSECNATRFLRCPTVGANDLGSPRFGTPSTYELAAGPFRSQVLGRAAFVTELERRLPHVRATPAELAPVEHAVRREMLVWAIRMVSELLALPEAPPPWSHERLTAERQRLVAIDGLFRADAPRVAKLLPQREVDERVPRYTVVLGLRGELRALVDACFATKDLPTAADLRAHLAPKARSIEGEVVDLGTDVASVRLSNDAQGRAVAELAVTRGTIADVEAVFDALDSADSAKLVRYKRAVVVHVTRRGDDDVERVVVGFERGKEGFAVPRRRPDTSSSVPRRPVTELLTPEERSGFAAAEGVFALVVMDYDDSKGMFSSREEDFYLKWAKATEADAAWVREHVALWGTSTSALERAGFPWSVLAGELALSKSEEDPRPLATISTAAGTLVCVTSRSLYVILEKPEAGVFY
jgi:hypothetical protein